MVAKPFLRFLNAVGIVARDLPMLTLMTGAGIAVTAGCAAVHYLGGISMGTLTVVGLGILAYEARKNYRGLMP